MSEREITPGGDPKDEDEAPADSASKEEPEAEPEPDLDRDVKVDKHAAWKEMRREIAEEPGNHASFALWLSVGVIVILAAFFFVRLYVLR